LLRSLALNLVNKGKIKTTEAKAKELRPFMEKIITLAKKNTLASRRLALSRLFNRKPETEKIFSDIAPKYKDRRGGYVRIIKMVARKSDGSKMSLIEFV